MNHIASRIFRIFVAMYAQVPTNPHRYFSGPINSRYTGEFAVKLPTALAEGFKPHMLVCVDGLWGSVYEILSDSAGNTVLCCYHWNRPNDPLHTSLAPVPDI